MGHRHRSHDSVDWLGVTASHTLTPSHTHTHTHTDTHTHTHTHTHTQILPSHVSPCDKSKWVGRSQITNTETVRKRWPLPEVHSLVAYINITNTN